MLDTTKKKKVHEIEHLTKFVVTSMDILIQVNAHFLLQLFFPVPMQEDFKIKMLSFFYFPFRNFPLVSFLNSAMNYLPLSSEKLPLPDFVKSPFSLEFFPTSRFIYHCWWYCFWNPCCNIPSHSKFFLPPSHFFIPS